MSNPHRGLRDFESNPYQGIRYQPNLNAFSVARLINPDDGLPALFATLEQAMEARDYAMGTEQATQRMTN